MKEIDRWHVKGRYETSSSIHVGSISFNRKETSLPFFLSLLSPTSGFHLFVTDLNKQELTIRRPIEKTK